ncbi:hypothetical protein HY745_03835 [Candidatus Desantisbacteria bacterium]|nr:hypothetical protein [Candidatus Desantisbacteria bacterium]
MKRYVVWFFILVIVIYEVFNIFIHRSLSNRKANEQKELILYLNKLAEKRGMKSFYVTTAGIAKEENGPILSINIEMNEEFNKEINYINDIENSPFFIMIDNMSMHKEDRILKTKLVLKVPVD